MTTKNWAGIRSLLFSRGRAILLAAFLGTNPLAAQIVAWDVNGRNAAVNNPLSATLLDSHFTSATLTLGGGVSPSATASTFGGSGFDQTSLAGAIGAGDYLSFTVTPAPDTNFSLLSISLLFGVGTAVTNFNVALASSATGFTSGDAVWTFSFSTASPAAQTFALTDFPELQGLESPLELRVYGWRDTAGSTTFRIRNNAGGDLSVAGSVSAIPEPSTYASLAGIIGMAVAVGLRRKKAGRTEPHAAARRQTDVDTDRVQPSVPPH